jgi:S-DNA-T family DNA segregation ATPase FtsK/SpoIIIE
VRLFTPSGNRRLNELVGFVCLITSAILLLSLLSYSPLDDSFNVAGPAVVRAGSAARNWIGPVGAHVSDLLFQGFGFAAFLLPMGLAVFGVRWFRSRPIPAPVVKACGFLLLSLSAAALFALTGVPGVRSLLPPGGLAGTLLANLLRAAFNPLGASLVAISTLFVALFLSTRFSFSGAAAWIGSPVAGWQPFAPLKAKWAAWRAVQEEARQRRRLAQIRVNGRPPIVAKTAAKAGETSGPAAHPAEERPGPNQIVLREEIAKPGAVRGLAAAASAAASAISGKPQTAPRSIDRTAGPMVVPPPIAPQATATLMERSAPQPRIARPSRSGK